MPYCPHRWAQVRKASTESFIELLLSTPFPCPTQSPHEGFGGHRMGDHSMRGVSQKDLLLSSRESTDNSRKSHFTSTPRLAARKSTKCRPSMKRVDSDCNGCQASIPMHQASHSCHFKLAHLFFRWPDIYLALKYCRHPASKAGPWWFDQTRGSGAHATSSASRLPADILTPPQKS